MASFEYNVSIKLIEFKGKSDSVGHGHFSPNVAMNFALVLLTNAGAKARWPEWPLVREGAIYWVINDGYSFIDYMDD